MRSKLNDVERKLIKLCKCDLVDKHLFGTCDYCPITLWKKKCRRVMVQGNTCSMRKRKSKNNTNKTHEPITVEGFKYTNLLYW